MTPFHQSAVGAGNVFFPLRPKGEAIIANLMPAAKLAEFSFFALEAIEADLCKIHIAGQLARIVRHVLEEISPLVVNELSIKNAITGHGVQGHVKVLCATMTRHVFEFQKIISFELALPRE